MKKVCVVLVVIAAGLAASNANARVFSIDPVTPVTASSTTSAPIVVSSPITIAADDGDDEGSDGGVDGQDDGGGCNWHVTTDVDAIENAGYYLPNLNYWFAQFDDGRIEAVPNGDTSPDCRL